MTIMTTTNKVVSSLDDLGQVDRNGCKNEIMK